MSTVTVTGVTLVSGSAVTNEYYLKGGASLSNTGTINSSKPPDFTWAENSAGAVTVNNAGLILAAGDKKRDFDTSGTPSSGESPSSFTLINSLHGTIVAGGDVMRDQYANAGGSIAISNAGTIIAGTTLDGGAVNGRGFNFQQDVPVTLSNGSIVSSFSLLTINNTGVILTADDAIRATNQAGAGANAVSGYYNPLLTSDIFVSNNGTIISEGSLAAGGATGAGSGQAIDFADVNAAAGHVVITNGSGIGSTALIEATDNDGIRPGNNGVVINYGSIIGGQVFTAANEANPDKQGGNDGVSATYDELITVTNYGLIEGSKSAVYGERDPATETLSSDSALPDGTPTLSSDIIVFNEAGGTLVGQDGKGVGADFGNIYNAGTIIGEDNTNLQRGDGDGVDVNFTAYVTNVAGGVIDALGSEGVDDNGRTNVADGLAIGGGTVYNAGTIYSANNGVTVNNDGNPDGSRSGNADLVLTNDVGGTIIAEDGYAIRSENKAGTDQSNLPSVDYDTVTNYGTIISYGTIPDFSGTFEITTYTTTTINGTISYGTMVSPDTNINGVIEGVTYTGSADAGSIRFTEGDGSAIQLGEGNDILNEYGVLIATDGRAINLEGGNNTLNLFAGASISGRIDGGLGGTNLLDLNTPDGLGATPGATGGTLDNIIDFGTLDVLGGSWALEDTETYAAGVTVASGATLTVEAGADLVTDASSVTGTISLLPGGFVDFQGLSFSGTSMGVIGSNGVLDVTENGVTDLLTFASSLAGHMAVFSDDGTGGTDVALCYLRGTNILTPSGERPVEALRIGELVATRRGFRAIKWLGRQSYDLRFVRDNRARIPVCIRAGALGDGLPFRDLFVSPGHSLLVEDTLVLASALVNGLSITQNVGSDENPDVISYVQIELESHDCVLAEGAWSETYADGPGLRAQFHNAAEFDALYPDYVTPEEIALCAPRPLSGHGLEAALRPLVARAKAGLTPGWLEGSIDRVGDTVINGWAMDRAHPELPVLLEIRVDGRLVTTVLACQHRADLLAARKGNGNCAFSVTLDAPLPAGELRMVRALDGAEVRMSPACRARLAA